MAYRVVCGIDEAGRGALAGPLVVAGVILKRKIEGLKDSKKLSFKKREELFDLIIKRAQYKIVFIDNRFIDENGISKAIKKALKDIKDSLLADRYIMDGNSNFEVEGIEPLIKADDKIYQVSAASILAKVSRDRFMMEIDKKYPLYEFKNHKCYGTKEHVSFIKRYGYCEIHRKSFKIKSLVYPSLFDEL